MVAPHASPICLLLRCIAFRQELFQVGEHEAYLPHLAALLPLRGGVGIPIVAGPTPYVELIIHNVVHRDAPGIPYWAYCLVVCHGRCVCYWRLNVVNLGVVLAAPRCKGSLHTQFLTAIVGFSPSRRGVKSEGCGVLFAPG